MKIFLDDQGLSVRKSWVPSGWKVVTTPAEFKAVVVKALTDGEPIEEISFDNDLGEEIEGRHLVKWLQNEHPEIIGVNPEIKLIVHSQNNVAREALLEEIELLVNHHLELIEAKERPHPFGEMRKK